MSSTRTLANAAAMSAAVTSVATACVALDKAVTEAALEGVSAGHLSEYLLLFSSSIRTTSSAVAKARFQDLAAEAGWSPSEAEA